MREIKIVAHWSVNCSSGRESLSLDDLNCSSIEQWNGLSSEEKRERIQEALDDLPERVCILLDNYLLVQDES